MVGCVVVWLELYRDCVMVRGTGSYCGVGVLWLCGCCVLFVDVGVWCLGVVCGVGVVVFVVFRCVGLRGLGPVYVSEVCVCVLCV